MPGSFLDTNVLLYHLSTDPIRADRAEQLIREGGRISIQVLNELASVARRKMGLEWGELRQYVDTVCVLLTVVPLELEIHRHGLRLCERYGFSLYDGMIVSAALHTECDVLWTEDMQHGLVIEDRMRIQNPFT